MITPNKPSRLYEWKFHHSATKNEIAGYGHSADNWLEVTFGNDFVANSHGWKFRYQEDKDSGGAESHLLSFVSPWDTDFEIALSSWVSDELDLIRMHDASLVVNEDCTWELTFSSLEIFVDGVSVYTLGAQTVTGTDFDPRKCISKGYTQARLEDVAIPSSGSVIALPSCTNFFSIADWLVDTEAGINYGWRWDEGLGDGWEYDTVKILDYPTPVLVCDDCEATLPEINFALDNNSYDLTINSLHRFYHEKEMGCEYTCVFSTNPPCTDTWQDWWVRDGWELEHSELGAINWLMNITNHHLFGRKDCVLSTLEEEDDTVEVNAYSEFERKGEIWESQMTCTKLKAGTTPCIPGLDPPAPCPKIRQDDYQCYGLLQLIVTWEDEPDCIPVLPTDWHDCIENHRRYVAAFVDDDGLKIRHNTFEIPITDYTGVVTVASGGIFTSPSLMKGTNGLVYLSYLLADVPFYRTSADFGKTWKGAIALFSGTCINLRSINCANQLNWYAFKYDAGTSGPGKIYHIYLGEGDIALSSEATIKDTTGTAISFEDVVFDVTQFDGKVVLFARKNGSTTPTHFVSTDTGKTFREVYP